MATINASEISLDSSLEQFKEQFNTLRTDVAGVTANSLVEDAGGVLVFEGATDDAFETTLTVVDPTADRTVSLPNATDTLVGKNTTDILTNKTIDLAVNTITGSTASFNTALSDGSFATLAGSETLTNKTLTTPVISSISNTGTLTLPTSTDTLVGRATTDTLTNKTLTSPVISSISNSGTLTLPTSTDTLVGRATTDTLTNKTLTSPVISSISNTGTLTLPTSTDTLVGRATTDTLTNKTIDSASNTLTLDLGEGTLTGTTAQFNSALSDGSFATLAGTETLSNKTITSPTVSGLTLSDASIVIEGATDNAFETTLTVTDPTADRTITFKDASGTVAFTTDNVSSATLASTVTVSDSTANTNFPVVFHDESNGLLDDTGALRYNPSTGTLLVPNLQVAGTTTQVDTVTMEAANAIVFEGATADDFETTLTITDPTADRTITLQNASGTVAFLTDNVASATALETARTIAGQSFDGTANITIASTDLSNSSSITLNTATQTLTNKTLTAPVISSISNTGTLTLPTSTGTVALTSDITLSTLSVTASAAELNYNDITTLGTVQASKTVTADASGNVLFTDSDELRFGTSSDLSIYHDASNSYIIDSGTGNLFIGGDSDVKITNAAGTENKAVFTTDGAAELYYDNSKKIETTSAGVTITGTVTVTSPGNSLLIKNSAGTTLKQVNGV